MPSSTEAHTNNSVYKIRFKKKTGRFMKAITGVHFSAHNTIPKEPRRKKKDQYYQVLETTSQLARHSHKHFELLETAQNSSLNFQYRPLPILGTFRTQIHTDLVIT